MKISAIGIALIKYFESCRLSAYWDEEGQVWTIGYGHTRTAKKGMIITLEKADELLKEDILHFEAQINGLELSLNQNQFDALTSFVFNLGIGNLKTSTMLGMMRKDVNNFMIAYEFPKWRMAGGKILDGLEKRRKAEAKLYFTGKGIAA